MIGNIIVDRIGILPYNLDGAVCLLLYVIAVVMGASWAARQPNLIHS